MIEALYTLLMLTGFASVTLIAYRHGRAVQRLTPLVGQCGDCAIYKQALAHAGEDARRREATVVWLQGRVASLEAMLAESVSPGVSARLTPKAPRPEKEPTQQPEPEPPPL